jgi:uncharacterized protein (TIGR02246 family)
MIRRLLLIAVCLALPCSAFAGPKEDAQAVFDQFLTALTAANLDEVVGLFTPEALFWGTTMRDLATTPDAIRQYFSPMSRRKPNEVKASALGPASTLVLSDNTVLVSGMWQTERLVDDKPTVTELRISLAVVKRGDRWLIAQFHNSRRPEPAPATPVAR